MMPDDRSQAVEALQLLLVVAVLVLGVWWGVR